VLRQDDLVQDVCGPQLHPPTSCGVGNTGIRAPHDPQLVATGDAPQFEQLTVP
jgi:hypothetical protein